MRLRALREAAGMDQLDLAAASGVSHHTIVRIEAGRYAPRAETVRRLAHGLQIEPERFVSREPVGQPLLSLAEAAARLEVPTGRVGRWLQQGTLAGMVVSGKWRVVAAGVEELARSGRLRGRSRRIRSS
jgi:transcriptional regulator with XRE-family HTH domain